MRSQTAIQERSYGGRQLEDERTRQRVKVEQLLHESEGGAAGSSCGASSRKDLPRTKSTGGGNPGPPPLAPRFRSGLPNPWRRPACRFRHRVSGGLWKLIRRPEATSPCTV